MFTLKEISTIKKALQDKDHEEENILEPSKKFNHNLILGTDRLQEIYKEVCNNNNSYGVNSSFNTQISNKENIHTSIYILS